MYISLVVKNKFGFSDGSCTKELFDPRTHHLWERCNDLVFALIMNSVSRDLMSAILYSSSALLIWLDLMERFNKINGSRVFQIHREICLSQQGVNTIVAYFTRLCMLWEDFAAITYLPYCGCDDMSINVFV